MSRDRVKSRFKYIAELYTWNSIKDEEKENYEDSVEARPYISSKDINIDNSNIDYENWMYVKLDDTSFRIAPANSSLMCIEWGSAGKKKAFLDRDVSFVNKLCCFAPKWNINSKYLFYYLNNPEYEDLFRLNITGMIWGVSVSTLKDLPIFIPPLAEQQKIADYLDKKCSKIDEQKANYKKSIELLKEYKQSLITKAVTEGLNHNAELKDSVIGKIPIKWNLSRIKYSVKFQQWKQVDIDKQYEDCLEWMALFIRIIDITQWNEPPRYVYRDINDNYVDDDIIMVRYWASSWYAVKSTRWIIANNLFSIRPHDFLNKDFLLYLLKSENIQKALTTDWAAMPAISFNMFDKIYIPLPTIEEQKQIADYLDSQCSRIDTIISYREEMIEKLEEYKKSLIYECVTGKKEIL